MILASVVKGPQDSGLIVPVFQKGDDPIDVINHMMSFLTAVVTSRYPTTNNQLRNSSNPRKQATINNGRVTLQPIQGRQTSFAAGTSRTYTPGASRSNSGKQKTEKVLLVQAQAHGQILNEEELVFLADPDIPEVALMANLSHYGSDALAEVHNHDNMNNNVAHKAVQVMPSSQQSNVVNHSETEITSYSNNIPYSQYVIESQQVTIQNSNSSAQQDDLILFVIEQLKTQVANCTKTNLENKSVNDTLTAELERYKEQVKVLKEGQNVDLRSKDNVSDTCAQFVEIDLLKQTLSEHLKEKESLLQTKAQQSKPKLYVSDIIVQTNPIVIPDSEETLALAEESRSKMLLKHKDNMMLEKEKQNSVNSSDPNPSSRPTKVEVPCLSLRLNPMTKVIKGEFEKIKDVKVEDVSLTCDTPLEVFNKEHEADDDMGGDDEEELTDEESSDDEDEIADVFRIDTNIFNYETPLCSAFNEFNYLLKPWLDNGIRKEPTPVKHTCKPFIYKTGYSEWPTCSWRDDGYCNGGNLPRTYIIGNQLHYQDYEWYEALEDCELKNEALRNKAIMEGFIKDDDDESRYKQMKMMEHICKL
ncbi:hypothetical protein Tco_0122773 [Tanacetum coccineum]